jgi:hypothetical protein
MAIIAIEIINYYANTIGKNIVKTITLVVDHMYK